MKEKILKILSLTLCNVLLFSILLLISDFILFKIEYKNLKLSQEENLHFFNNIFKPTIQNVTNLEFEKEDSSYGDGSQGRKPDGLTFDEQNPIIVFGCSFAYGHYLYQNQTFSYKLANILKRSVYNRALAGAGPQHAYYQTSTEDFYKEVPKSNTVIYVMIDDHYRRIQGEMFGLLDTDLNLHYKIKDKNLVMDNYNNYILNALKFSKTLILIRQKYKKYYIDNPENADKLTDEILLYYSKIKENLETKWNNKINFYVIFYEDIKYSDMLQNKLENSNFKVLKTSDLTNKDLNSPKYKMQDNGHPTEEAWNLLTPLILKNIDLK